VHEAFKRGIPIFGICRGSQLINVAFGGTLIQHIPSAGAHRWHLGHDHRVDLLKGTKILKAMKDLQPWVVSIHHQAVDKVAPGFVVGARSRDGIIEAIESHPKSGLPWIVATQFHPEIQTSRDEQSLFTEFVREAARVADLPEPKPFELPKAKPWVPAAKWNGTTTKWNTVVPGGKITPATSAIVVHQERIIDDPGKAIERWFCFRCGIEFDVRADQVDHMYLMHDVDLVPLMTSTQFDRYVDEITDDAEYQALEERWLNSRV
jgi:GMP synthase-like glutamine amidotransferase